MTKHTCSCCDTLRNDADDGDECLECGTTYQDPVRRSIAHTPEIVKPATNTAGVLTKPVGGGKIPAWRQPGWFHNVKMSNPKKEKRS